MRSLQSANLIVIGSDAAKKLMDGCTTSAEIEKCLAMCDAQDPTTAVFNRFLAICKNELDGENGYKAKLKSYEDKLLEVEQENEQLKNSYATVQRNLVKAIGLLSEYSTKLKCMSEDMKKSHDEEFEEYEQHKRQKK